MKDCVDIKYPGELKIKRVDLADVKSIEIEVENRDNPDVANARNIRITYYGYGDKIIFLYEDWSIGNLMDDIGEYLVLEQALFEFHHSIEFGDLFIPDLKTWIRRAKARRALKEGINE